MPAGLVSTRTGGGDDHHGFRGNERMIGLGSVAIIEEERRNKVQSN